MAEFKDSSFWIRLSFLMTLLGLFCFYFSVDLGVMHSSLKDSVEACIVIAVICYVGAVFVILIMVFLDEVKGNKIAAIVFIVLAFIAGIIYLIGLAIWSGHIDPHDPPAAGTTTGVWASLFIILSAIFVILDLVGVGPK